MNSEQKYLVGDYDLEILTLPRMVMRGIQINQGEVFEVNIEKPGTLTVTPDQEYIASICTKTDDRFETIYEWPALAEKTSLMLQPGEYFIVYRQDKYKRSDFTLTRKFVIKSGSITSLKL
jgi:Ca-activated chloride channel family protein